MTVSRLELAVDMMIRTDRMHKTLIDSRAGALGIHRTHHRILMYLSRHGTLTSQKELAEHLDITPAAVTGALKKLISDGYIERTLGRDNRYNELKITERGEALVNRTHELFSSTDRSLFEGFSDGELETYVECLEKLQHNIKSQLHGKAAGREEKNEKMV